MSEQNLDLSKYVFDPEQPGKRRVYKLLKKVIQDENNVVLFDREAFAFLFGRYLWDDEVIHSLYTVEEDEFGELTEIQKIEAYLENYSLNAFLTLAKKKSSILINESILSLFDNYGFISSDKKYYSSNKHHFIIQTPEVDNELVASTLQKFKIDKKSLIVSETGWNKNVILITQGKDFIDLPFAGPLLKETNVFVFLEEFGKPFSVAQSPNTKPIILKKPEHLHDLFEILLREAGKSFNPKLPKKHSFEKVEGYIERLFVERFFSIEEAVIDKLEDKREIYLVGENGDGKTLFLQALVLALQGYRIQEGLDKSKIGHILSLLDQNSKKDSFSVLFPAGFSIGTGSLAYHKDVYAYGVNRNRSNTEEQVPYGFETLFFDPDRIQYLESPVEWLKYLYTKALEKEAGKGNGQAAISLETAIEILKDIIDDDGQKQLEISVSADAVTFSERGSENLRFDQLSEGYRTVMTWLVDLVSRLSKSQPDAKKTQDFTGIVIVDELGLHLHPKWEYELPKKLRRLFPKIQFFFSTHSPILIQGASEDAVFYRLYKEEGETKISEPFYQKDMNELMLNGILTSPLFGLGTARMRNAAKDYTHDEFVVNRIRKKIDEKIEAEKKEGKAHFSVEEIDSMVAEALSDFPEE